MNAFIQLVNSLKRGGLSPVYLLYGEETYLREQAVARFKEFLVKADESGLNLDIIDGETATPSEIAARADTLPFLAGKRLVVVKNPVFFKTARRAGGGDSGGKMPGVDAPLLEYLKKPAASTCLVFSTGEPVDKRKRLFQAIRKNGQALEFSFLSRGELARWLAQKAGAVRRRFAPGAADVLLDLAGPALQSLVLELEKLFCYTAGKEVITPDDVRQVCPVRPEENVFAIVDAVGNMRCGEALTAIKDLLAAKEPPLKILALISRKFRLLLQVSELLGRGCPPREIAAGLSLHPYECQKLLSQCKNFSMVVLMGAIEDLFALDAAVKAGRAEFYPAVETFLLKLCIGRSDSPMNTNLRSLS